MDIRNESKMKDMVTMVTGGGKGIGRAIALGYAEAGANVVVCGRNLPPLEAVSQEASQIGALVIPVKADVRIETEVKNLVEQAIQKFGKIDVLVNNSGVPGPMKLITDIVKQEWDEVIDTNLTGVFLCSRAVLRHMVPFGKGNIINISSGAGMAGPKKVRSLPYNISKYGVEGLTYALSVQMKPYGICVNALRPGVTDTDFHRNSPPEFRSRMQPAERVKKLAISLALQTVDTMTGQSIALNEWEKTSGSA